LWLCGVALGWLKAGVALVLFYAHVCTETPLTAVAILAQAVPKHKVFRMPGGTHNAHEGPIWCTPCEMWLNSQNQFDEHKIGKKHGKLEQHRHKSGKGMELPLGTVRLLSQAAIDCMCVGCPTTV
jgi:hypothetical protein